VHALVHLLDKIFWPLFLAGTTLTNYTGARLVGTDRNVPWRSFFTALVNGFLTIILVSMSTETLAVNPLYWMCVYAVIAAVVTKPALRTTAKKALMPWLLSVVFAAVVFLMRYFFLGIPTIGK
jgi:hypothetical protein